MSNVVTSKAAEHQANPVKNENACVQDLVIEDIQARKQVGVQRYGTVLQPFNGRDALMDAYQEALDLCQYLKQAIYERDNTSSACPICKAAGFRECNGPHPAVAPNKSETTWVRDLLSKVTFARMQATFENHTPLRMKIAGEALDLVEKTLAEYENKHK